MPMISKGCGFVAHMVLAFFLFTLSSFSISQQVTEGGATVFNMRFILAAKLFTRSVFLSLLCPCSIAKDIFIYPFHDQHLEMYPFRDLIKDAAVERK